MNPQPRHTAPLKARRSRSALTLVELVVVIAVLGILTSIAVPAWAKLFDPMEDTKAQRNAQILANTYGAAQAAGLKFTTPSNNLTEIVQNIVDGGVVKEKGPMEGQHFGVNGLSSDEQNSAIRFLEYDAAQDRLIYKGPSS